MYLLKIKMDLDQGMQNLVAYLAKKDKDELLKIAFLMTCQSRNIYESLEANRHLFAPAATILAESQQEAVIITAFFEKK